MRNPELLISLLKEMSEADLGRLYEPMTFGMSTVEQQRYHHIELLEDTGHVQQISEGAFRITSQGYDFLNALNSQPEAKIHFLELINKGLDYGAAAIQTIEFVRTLVEKLT